MEEGLYESVLTTEIAREVEALSDLHAELVKVNPADQAHVLARHLSELLHQRLADEQDADRRLAFAKKLLVNINEDAPTFAEPVRQLHAVRNLPAPGQAARYQGRPKTPLSEAALLTNTQGEPNLGSEIKAELDTADEVDLLCAFVKWYGLRLLEPELQRLRERGAPLRVITTTYIGATDPNALDRLVRDFGAEVKISYDAQRTRLHAKAWMFRRATTFDTAYVGSSNLSTGGAPGRCGVERPAVAGRHSGVAREVPGHLRHVLERPELRVLRPGPGPRPAGRRPGRGFRTTHARAGHPVPVRARGAPLPVPADDAGRPRRRASRPRPPPQPPRGGDRDREDGRRRPRLPPAERRAAERPSLLFVAHRREILEQSLRTYREVLNDANFAELYVGGTRPERWRHVFASVQSLQLLRRRPPSIPPHTTSSSSTSSTMPKQRPTVGCSIGWNRASSRAHRHARTHRRPRRPRHSSPVARLPSCDCGMPSAPTCCARSTTSPSLTVLICARSAGRVAGTTTPSSRGCTRATEHEPPSCLISCGTSC